MRSYVVGKQHRGSRLQHCSSDIAHSPVSVRTLLLDPSVAWSFRIGAFSGSLSVTLSSVCLQTDEEAQQAPLVDVDRVPLLDSQPPWEELRTRCEVAAELIFGITVSVPMCSLKFIQEMRPPTLVVVSSPFCVWFLRHRNRRDVRRLSQTCPARSSPITWPIYQLCPNAL